MIAAAGVELVNLITKHQHCWLLERVLKGRKHFTNVAKDDSILCGCNLDVGFDVAEVMRCQKQWLGLLHQLEVT